MLKKVVPILILIVSSVLVIFYKFNEVPKNLSFDEVEFTKLALSLDGKPYTPYSTYATGHATLYFYILLFSFKIFGISNFALRLPSAIFGVLNVFVFYFLMRIAFQQFNNLTTRLPTSERSKSNYVLDHLALILSLILITSHWYFNFARFAFEATFLLFLELSSIYFFFRYLKSKQTGDIILTTIFVGSAYNSYTPGRIFFSLIFVFLIIYVKRQFNHVKRGSSNLAIKQLIPSVIIFIITILPLSLYFINNPDIRFNQQFFLKNTELPTVKKILFLGDNLKKTILMFNFYGDINGRHNYPGKAALNPLLGILFIIGLCISIRNYKKFPNSFFIVYFILSLIPSMLTYPWETPNMLRTFTAIPAVIYFIGISVEQIYKFVGNGLKSFPTKTFIVLFFLIFLSSIYELRTYFKYQSEVFKKAFEVKKSVGEIDFNKPIIFKQLGN